MPVKHPSIKKLYFPGLISLLGIPLLTFGYLLHKNTFFLPRAMDVVWMNGQELQHPDEFMAAGIKQLKSRHYTAINLTGNTTADSLKLLSLKVSITRLSSVNDFINGYRLNFGVHVKYQTVVTTFDMIHSFPDSIRFSGMPFGDSFYFFKFKPDHATPAPTRRFFCGTRMFTDYVDGGGSINQSLTNYLLQYWDENKQIWPVCLLILLILPVISRRFKPRTPKYKIT